MSDKYTIFSLILGLMFCLASLALAVTGYHHMNGMFIPSVLAVGGTFIVFWTIAINCLRGM